MKIGIIGAGYVGLVSAACFAEFGHEVTCVDIDGQRISGLKAGKCPIYEPGLSELLGANFKRERLFFTEQHAEVAQKSEVIFIAVGTPASIKKNGLADLRAVEAAIDLLLPQLPGPRLLVLKSTVPVGTNAMLLKKIRAQNSRSFIDVASNPEFLRQGSALHDFLNPDRIVLGVNTEQARQMLLQVYHPFDGGNIPFLVTKPATAELIKYTANAFLAMKVGFINEIASLCESTGADIQEVARGIGLDHRIGSQYLQPGPGFGGSCLLKDAMALAHVARDHEVPLQIIEAVIEANQKQKHLMIQKIRTALGQNRRGKTLAVLGLTFKPDTDDMRHAPALEILPPLLEEDGVIVRAHDPAGIERAKTLLPGVSYYQDPYAACKGADAVCLLTDWNLYRALDLSFLKAQLARPVFIDLRNVYDPTMMAAAGFTYITIGRSQ